MFIDGDIIMERHFIADHERLAEKGYFVIGSRASLKNKLTLKLIKEKKINISFYTKGVRRKENALWLPFLTFWTKTFTTSVASMAEVPIWLCGLRICAK